MIPLLITALLAAPPAPTAVVRADLDGDGGREEIAWYTNRTRTRGFVTIGAYTSALHPMWKLAAGDLDGDGRAEVLLGIWSRRRRHVEPEPHRTVWVLAWDGWQLVPDWRGSALGRPLVDFGAADLDGDGEVELLALERVAKRCRLTAYRYTGFGFRALARRASDCGFQIGPDANVVTPTRRLRPRLNGRDLTLSTDPPGESG